MAHKIDRLSLLPNELLDHIFDLAYSIDTPSTGALSKHLLPFHIIGSYRRISLTKPHNIVRLIQTVNRHPNLGRCIEELVLDCDVPLNGPTSSISEVEVVHFFSHLERLNGLFIGAASSVAQVVLEHASTSQVWFLPALRHLQVPTTYIQDTPFVDYTSLPTLESLSIVDHDGHDGHFLVHDFPPLPDLWDLTLCGSHADDLAIVDFCSLCPALTHLTLSSYLPHYTPLLRELPTTLLWLELRLEGDEAGAAQHCDQVLPRFQLLEHLILDDYLYSTELPTHLASLARLEYLELGYGYPSLQGIIALIDGTTRLPSLQSLELHLFYTEAGTRLDVDDKGGIVGDWDLDHGLQVPQDWVAEENGVDITGSIVESMEIVDSYFLEIANIAIYRCFRYNTLEPYSKLQDRGLGSRLPALDLESLDPNNLKLIKTELPDEGWFALTLE
ncbi:hypothetical protein JCM5353_002468 [Sporobolomyces roseus]